MLFILTVMRLFLSSGRALLCVSRIHVARFFITESMTINITSSKTDQYREGSSLVVDCTGTPTYLVAMMERYFSMGGLCTQEQGKVFWAKGV